MPRTVGLEKGDLDKVVRAFRIAARETQRETMNGTQPSLRWDVAVEGLWGSAPVHQGLAVEGARRRLLQLLPTIGYNLGSTELEITGRFSIAGFVMPWSLGPF